MADERINNCLRDGDNMICLKNLLNRKSEKNFIEPRDKHILLMAREHSVGSNILHSILKCYDDCFSCYTSRDCEKRV